MNGIITNIIFFLGLSCLFFLYNWTAQFCEATSKISLGKYSSPPWSFLGQIFPISNTETLYLPSSNFSPAVQIQHFPSLLETIYWSKSLAQPLRLLFWPLISSSISIVFIHIYIHIYIFFIQPSFPENMLMLSLLLRTFSDPTSSDSQIPKPSLESFCVKKFPLATPSEMVQVPFSVSSTGRSSS